MTFNKKNVITYNTTKPLTIPNCKPAKQVTQQKPQEAQAFDEQFCDNEEQGDYIGKFHGTLPPSWNKDGYHFVTIHVVTRNGGTYGYGGYKTYQGYLWASDNWVEVHCFKFGGLKEQKRYFTGNTKQDEGQQGIHHWITRSGEVVVESMPVYTGRVISAILPRSRVSFQNDQIIISVNKEDKQRWHAWHPEDDYITQFYDSMTYKTYWEVIDRKAW